MKLKSYFSRTVEDAMEEARRELGEDALLVNARPTGAETRHLGAYEVVFGSTGSPQIPAAAFARPVRANPIGTPVGDPIGNPMGPVSKNAGPPADRLSQDVAEMRREIERLAQSFRGAGVFAQADASGAAVYARLIDQEVDAGIAQAVAQGASLDQFFETTEILGRKGAGRAVIALVGPPGAGKTTTLVKLAARYGLSSRKPAQIITTDVFRIAAADQLRSLASILGMGCDVAETPVALAQALEEHRSKDLVFIDTPGLSSGEMEDGADLAALIAAHPEIDTHLVLPASMKSADMARIIERYAVFQPGKLLFTRLDETERYGALISEASRRSLPISFLANGQQIPDDLECASKQRLSELILGPQFYKPGEYKRGEEPLSHSTVASNPAPALLKKTAGAAA